MISRRLLLTVKTFAALITIILLMCSPLIVMAEDGDPALIDIIPDQSKKSMFSPQTNSGAATYSIPIEVPPGRAQMTPQLNVIYNSSSGNGLIGVGWFLNVGFIERSQKNGINYSANDFVVNKGGGVVALKSRSTTWPGYYGEKIEKEFTKYDYLGATSGWKAYRKNGYIYSYGTSTDSIIDGTEGVFKWCLKEIEDPNGNTITYVYSAAKDQGQRYLEEIQYSGNSIKLFYESRSDEIESWRTQSEVVTAKRLDYIEVWIWDGSTNNKVWVYYFNYGQSNGTGRSLLSSVVQMGFDDLDNEVTFSTTILDWQEDNIPAAVFTGIEDGSDDLHDWGFSFFSNDDGSAYAVLDHILPFDYNGDGKQDLIIRQIEYDEDNQPATDHANGGIFISDGDGTYNSPSWFLSTQQIMDNSGYYDINASENFDDAMLTGDFDGDGLGDLMFYRTNSVYVARSNGDYKFSEFYDSGSIGGDTLSCDSLACSVGGAATLFPFDYNGDGKSDIFMYRPYGDDRNYDTDPANDEKIISIIKLNQNNTSQLINSYEYDESFEGLDISDLEFALEVGPPISFTDCKLYAFPADFNGDGLSDICIAKIQGWSLASAVSNYSKVVVALSEGDGSFNITEDFNVNATSNPTKIDELDSSVVTTIFPFDYNGDGLSDLFLYTCNYNDYPTFTQTLHIARSNGDGTFTIVHDSLSIGGYSLRANDIFSFDHNGDGLDDIFTYPQGTSPDYDKMLILRSNGDATFTSELRSDMVGNYDVAARDCDTASVCYKNNKALPFDANGDGKDDLLLYRHTSSGDIIKISQWGYNNPPQYADLLTDVTIQYAGAASDHSVLSFGYDFAGEQDGTHLPFIMPVVDSITVDPKVSTQSAVTTEFSYEDGYYDAEDREFRGFDTVIQDNPDGTSVVTTYETNDDYEKGTPTDIELYDDASGGGTRLSSKALSWATSSLEGDSRFVSLTDKASYDYYSGITINYLESYTYDSTNGNLLTVTRSGNGGAENVTTTYTYDNYGDWLWRKTSELIGGATSGAVRKTAWDYYDDTATDGFIGNMKYEDRYDDISGSSYVRTEFYDYDSYGNLEEVIDPENNSTIYTYDTTGIYVASVTNALSHQTQYTYDYRFGKKTRARDVSNGNIDTTYTYDNFGRVETVTYPDDGTTEYQYFDSASPRSVLKSTLEGTDTPSYVNQYTWIDGLNRQIQTVSFGESGNLIAAQTEYDDMGRVALKSGPFFASETSIGYPLTPSGDYFYTETAYTDRGRPETVTTPDTTYGTVQTGYTYNRFDTIITDPDNASKTITKDHLGRITQVTEAGDNGDIETDYAYNAAGDLTQVTDALDNETTITYDDLGRKTAIDDPDMGAWSYTYTDNSNLDIQTDARGYTIDFDYDDLNRVTTKTSKDDMDITLATVTYAYDETSLFNGTDNRHCIGRLYQISTGTSGVTDTINTYDAMGRVTSASRDISGDATTRSTAYEYDKSGKLTGMTYPDSYELGMDYYDGSNLLFTVAETTGTPAVTVTTHATYAYYEPTGQVGQVTFPNNTTTVNTYDSQSLRLTASTTDDGANTIQDRTYSYSEAGDIEQIYDAVDDVTYNYYYDSLHRLIAEQTTGDAPEVPLSKMTYSYSPTTEPLHAVDSINIVSESDFDGATYNFNYDENGNLSTGYNLSDPASVQSRSVTFDADNMPTQILNGTTDTVNLLYDGEAQRARKSGTGTTIHYIGDHFEVAGTTPVKYIFANGQRIAMIADGSTYYFHKDHLGSNTVVTDLSESEVATTSYLPFGGKRGTSDITSYTNYKYTDQELDAGVDLYNYNARLYDPAIGMFISADSIVPDYTNPQALNRYSYVLNNPLIYVDPSGHANYVLLVGDPMHSGLNFERAAQTSQAALMAQGHIANVYPVRSVNAFNFAINVGPEIDGGVYAFGHANSTLLALSMKPGPGTNLDSSTVNQISWDNLGGDAIIILYGCNTGNEEFGTSIAQLVANASGRNTIGFSTGLGFSGEEGEYLYGKDAKPPETGPIYMVPVPPGEAVSFEPERSWLGQLWDNVTNFFGLGESSSGTE